MTNPEALRPFVQRESDWSSESGCCYIAKAPSVMLSEALQRNVKHEARLSNISDLFSVGDGLADDQRLKAWPRPEYFRTALQLRVAQNDMMK